MCISWSTLYLLHMEAMFVERMSECFFPLWNAPHLPEISSCKVISLTGLHLVFSRVLYATTLTHAILRETVNFWKPWDMASISLTFHMARALPCPGSREREPLWLGRLLGGELVLRWTGEQNLDGGRVSGKPGWPRRWPQVTDFREAVPTAGQRVKSVLGRVWRRAGELRGQVKMSSSGLTLRTVLLGRCLLYRAAGSLTLGAYPRALNALGGHWIPLHFPAS